MTMDEAIGEMTAVCMYASSTGMLPKDDMDKLIDAFSSIMRELREKWNEEWISCKECMPEYGEWVLAYNVEDEFKDCPIFPAKRYVYNSTRYKIDGLGGFTEYTVAKDKWESIWGSYHSDKDFTHWMPLPKQPGGDE